MTMTKAEFTTEFIDPTRAEVDAAAILFNDADAALAAAKDAKEAARSQWEQAKAKLAVLRDCREMLYGA